MGFVAAAIWFFIARSAGQLHWKHGVLMLVLAGIYARTITYRQEGTDPVGTFALAMIMQFAGYALGLFFAKRRAEEQD